MFELFMYVYFCNALSAWFFAVDRALNSYFMIMIMKLFAALLLMCSCGNFSQMVCRVTLNLSVILGFVGLYGTFSALCSIRDSSVGSNLEVWGPAILLNERGTVLEAISA